jgi:transcription initiation factor TFIIIB Brf1 subunit/transcription initiation factor TFIIB
MKIKINDVFGFQKAINFDKLNDPETLNQLSKMFNVDNEKPETTYKKAVSNLKVKVKIKE